ncbi:CRISPR-associated endonuclease Cas6 [Desulfobacca acetoxidans]
MNNEPTIEQCILKLRFNRSLSLKCQAKDLRGAIAGRYKENDLFHQHSAEGRFIYRYPLIQYKIIQGDGIIVGLGQGALNVAMISLLNENLELGYEHYIIMQQEMSLGKKHIGIVEQKIKYYFLSPWLALNEKNSRDYYRMGSPQERRHLLEKILTGNIISLSKGIGYTIPAPICVNLDSLREIRSKLKDTPMLGFTGVFSVNYDLPDYWGIGKSVARGFGTIRKIN